jgi:hypothetical protein
VARQRYFGDFFWAFQLTSGTISTGFHCSAGITTTILKPVSGKALLFIMQQVCQGFHHQIDPPFAFHVGIHRQ